MCSLDDDRPGHVLGLSVCPCRLSLEMLHVLLIVVGTDVGGPVVHSLLSCRPCGGHLFFIPSFIGFADI